MSCNCKKKAEIIDAKYGDGNLYWFTQKLNPILRIIQFFAQMIFGIFFGVIIIVMAVPMLLYVILCIMFGREPKIDANIASRYLSRK